ncbi:MAG: adenylate/guanylate cyclase domain-containing protein [Desulfobacteraceae bacterium]
MPEFRIVTGYGKSFNYGILQDITTIGRSKDNHVVLTDHTASRRHAKLRKTPDGYLLLDLESHNGTYVNGARITGRILKHNDFVEIGTSVLTFQYEIEEEDESRDILRMPTHREEAQSKTEIANQVVIEQREGTQEVVASIRSHGAVDEDEFLSDIEAEEKDTSKISLLNLQRSNKILYVLYQVSRTLLSTTDMDALLHKILNLVFQVIDADFGFIIVLGGRSGEFVPKAIKNKRPPEAGPQALQVNRALINKVIEEKVSLLTSITVDDPLDVEAKPRLDDKTRTCMMAPLWRKDEVIGLIQLQSFHNYNMFTKPDLDLLTTLSNQMAVVMEQASLMEKVHHEEMMRNRLERFHSPDIVDVIISGDSEDEDAMLSPKEKTVTVLFSDIVNFTPLSERLSPSEISQLLNRFFREMNDIIFDYNGTLDKYMGDAIMAIFGAPIERENDAERAILAALEMRKALFRMNRSVEPDKIFDIRLGLNTGRVLAGNLGSPRRMDYTVIGDVVNTASRLQKIARPNQILIGEATYECVKERFDIRRIGLKSIKGKRRAITVYEVLG